MRFRNPRALDDRCFSHGRWVCICRAWVFMHGHYYRGCIDPLGVIARRLVGNYYYTKYRRMCNDRVRKEGIFIFYCNSISLSTEYCGFSYMYICTFAHFAYGFTNRFGDSTSHDCDRDRSLSTVQYYYCNSYQYGGRVNQSTYDTSHSALQETIDFKRGRGI
jgi:hypothetical protein